MHGSFFKDIKDIDFSVNPLFDYQLQANNNILKVLPENNLAPGTKYTYIVKYKSQTLPSRSYSFLTAGEIKDLPDTQPEGAAEAEAEFQRQNHPDVFLSNFTPFESATFSLSSEFIGEENGHFRFTVTSQTSAGKNDFLNWLKSLNLSDNQIAELDISYN